MLMTTTEASSVWCPMARVVFLEDDSAPSCQPAWNRVQPDQPEAEVRVTTATMCLGHRCAMWRWEVPEQKPVAPPLSQRMFGTVYDADADVPRRGYCGLAGSPVAP